MSQMICERQRARDVGHEVALALGRRRVDDRPRPVARPPARGSPIWCGVKPRFTISRSFVCRGSSMLIIEPKNSSISGGKSGMFEPRPQMNSSGLRLTCITSA